MGHHQTRNFVTTWRRLDHDLVRPSALHAMIGGDLSRIHTRPLFRDLPEQHPLYREAPGRDVSLAERRAGQTARLLNSLAW